MTAIFYSLIETCRLSGIDPKRYFRRVAITPRGACRDGRWRGSTFARRIDGCRSSHRAAAPVERGILASRLFLALTWWIRGTNRRRSRDAARPGHAPGIARAGPGAPGFAPRLPAGMLAGISTAAARRGYRPGYAREMPGILREGSTRSRTRACLLRPPHGLPDTASPRAALKDCLQGAPGRGATYPSHSASECFRRVHRSRCQ